MTNNRWEAEQKGSISLIYITISFVPAFPPALIFANANTHIRHPPQSKDLHTSSFALQTAPTSAPTTQLSVSALLGDHTPRSPFNTTLPLPGMVNTTQLHSPYSKNTLNVRIDGLKVSFAFVCNSRPFNVEESIVTELWFKSCIHFTTWYDFIFITSI